MARRFDIDVCGQGFHGDTASAKNQWDALHVCTSTRLITAIQDGASDMALVAALMSIPMADIKRLESLLVERRVFRSQDNVDVGVNLFDGKVHEYALLVAKVVQENVGPFWQLREPSAKAPEQV